MSGNREELDHLMAQWHECPVPVAAEGLDRVFSAFKQALAELGIPDHPAASALPGTATAWRWRKSA